MLAHPAEGKPDVTPPPQRIRIRIDVLNSCVCIPVEYNKPLRWGGRGGGEEREGSTAGKRKRHYFPSTEPNTTHSPKCVGPMHGRCPRVCLRAPK